LSRRFLWIVRSPAHGHGLADRSLVQSCSIALCARMGRERLALIRYIVSCYWLDIVAYKFTD
jgi:hypothetical protein